MKFWVVLCVLGCGPPVFGESLYLGMYLQGSKIGYASYVDRPEQLGGRPMTRSDSHTVIDAGLLGAAVKMTTDSTTWTNPAGRPIRMKFLLASGGRTQTVDAVFGLKNVVVDVNNNGTKSHHALALPKGMIVDDPLTLVLQGHATPGQTKTFFVLDPMTVSFMKNDVRLVGPSTTVIQGKTVSATEIEMIDPRATMRVFVSSKGDLVHVEGPMGIEMIPESKAVATAPNGKYAPTVDLAVTTSLHTDIPIEDPSHLTELKLLISGRDLSSAPSDESQSVRKVIAAWEVDVHPVRLSESAGDPISVATDGLAQWTKATLDMPSDSLRFVQLARRIVGPKKDVKSAALAIRRYVYDTMQPNAGIGVLRDATEILQTKEGVCRDYAVLTTTLLRAAGIPARLASGIVNWDGAFYYHAWSEAWDGHRWLGMDSTTPDEQLSAGHIKLAEGNIEDAFTFTFLDKAHIEVLSARH